MEQWKIRVLAYLDSLPAGTATTEQLRRVRDTVRNAPGRQDLAYQLSELRVERVIGPTAIQTILNIAYGGTGVDEGPFPVPGEALAIQEEGELAEAAREVAAAEAYGDAFGPGRIVVPAVRDRRVAQRTRVIRDAEEVLDEIGMRVRPSYSRSTVPEAYKAHAVKRGKTDYVLAVDERIIGAGPRRRSVHDMARAYNHFVSCFGTLSTFDITLVVEALRETLVAGSSQIRNVGVIPGGFNPPFRGE